VPASRQVRTCDSRLPCNVSQGCVAAARSTRVVHGPDTTTRMQLVAALHPPAVPQQLSRVAVLPSPRQAIVTLSDPSATAGDVLTALMATAVTAARGSHATADMVRAGCIEALTERLRMSPTRHARPKDERRCGLHAAPVRC